MVTRKKLEALVWRDKHRDHKGVNAAGERTVTRFVDEHGTCLFRLQDLTLGELVEELKRSTLVATGLLAWRLVVTTESGADEFLYRVQGVFGLGLVNDQIECERRVTRQTGVRALSWVWAGPKPHVGELIDFRGQSLVTLASETEREQAAKLSEFTVSGLETVGNKAGRLKNHYLMEVEGVSLAHRDRALFAARALRSLYLQHTDHARVCQCWSQVEADVGRRMLKL